MSKTNKIGRLDEFTVNCRVPAYRVGELSGEMGDISFQSTYPESIHVSPEMDLRKVPQGFQNKLGIPEPKADHKILILRQKGQNTVVSLPMSRE
jgi:hypothetical protein